MIQLSPKFLGLAREMRRMKCSHICILDTAGVNWKSESRLTCRTMNENLLDNPTAFFFILSLTAMYWSMEICASWCMAAIHSPDLWGLLHIVKVIHCKHISCGPERNDTMTKLVIFHSFMLIIAVPFRIHPCCIIHPIPSGDAFCYRTTSALLTCRTTSLGLPS